MGKERGRKDKKKVLQLDDTVENLVQLEGDNSNKGELEHKKKIMKTKQKRTKNKTRGEEQKDIKTTTKKVRRPHDIQCQCSVSFFYKNDDGFEQGVIGVVS
ncbi:hypothetical protein Droror1_Dr00026831 [Drosera rotundifolia]